MLRLHLAVLTTRNETWVPDVCKNSFPSFKIKIFWLQ